MTKKYPRKGDCFDCGTNVPDAKVTAYAEGKGLNKIRNGCGECGQTWVKVPADQQRKRTTRTRT